MRLLSSFLDAAAFLTRVPVPRRTDFDLARAAWAFPVVGGLLGLLLAGVGLVGRQWWGVWVAAVLVLITEVVLTGALHLDGLADCADGCGGNDRTARLQIMKDHSVGVYGVAAIVLDLLLKLALVLELLTAGPVWLVLVLMPVAWAISRVALLPLATWLPYARTEGTGRSFVQGLTPGRVTAALVVTAGILAATTSAGARYGDAGLVVVALAVLGVVAGGAVAALAVAWWAHRRLGGVTGDVLGATAELTLLAGLLASLAILSAH